MRSSTTATYFSHHHVMMSTHVQKTNEAFVLLRGKRQLGLDLDREAF